MFLTGAASDPADKPGVAALTASMLAQGGTREMTYKQILDAMFPMATSVSSQVDKEMTVFSATTHVDNLEAFYKIFRAMLLDPGWRERRFRAAARRRHQLPAGRRCAATTTRNWARRSSTTKSTPDIPTATTTRARSSALQKMTVAGSAAVLPAHYTQDNLILGIAGGYPEAFLERMKKDFAAAAREVGSTAPAWKEPRCPARHSRDHGREGHALGGLLASGSRSR